MSLDGRWDMRRPELWLPVREKPSTRTLLVTPTENKKQNLAEDKANVLLPTINHLLK